MDQLEFMLGLQQCATDVANNYFDMYWKQFEEYGETITEFLKKEKTIRYYPKQYYNGNRYRFDHRPMTLKECMDAFYAQVGLQFIEMMRERIADLQGELEYLEKNIATYGPIEPEDIKYLKEDLERIEELKMTLNKVYYVIEEFENSLKDN